MNDGGAYKLSETQYRSTLFLIDILYSPLKKRASVHNDTENKNKILSKNHTHPLSHYTEGCYHKRMEIFPNNSSEVEESAAPQVPDAIMEVAEQAPFSKREEMMSAADEDTASFVRSLIEEPVLQ